MQLIDLEKASEPECYYRLEIDSDEAIELMSTSAPESIAGVVQQRPCRPGSEKGDLDKKDVYGETRIHARGVEDGRKMVANYVA